MCLEVVRRRSAGVEGVHVHGGVGCSNGVGGGDGVGVGVIGVDGVDDGCGGSGGGGDWRRGGEPCGWVVVQRGLLILEIAGVAMVVVPLL